MFQFIHNLSTHSSVSNSFSALLVNGCITGFSINAVMMIINDIFVMFNNVM